MNQKKCKKLRRLIFGNESSRCEGRKYSESNQKRYRDFDHHTKKSTFLTSCTLAVRGPRAQYQRIKHRLVARSAETEEGISIGKFTVLKKFQKKTKTQKNRDKRLRKKLRLLIN